MQFVHDELCADDMRIIEELDTRHHSTGSYLYVDAPRRIVEASGELLSDGMVA